MIAVPVPRDFVEVIGPDAPGFLQGQLSQDVATLAHGDSVWSFVLQPQGKVEALVRVLRTGPDGFVLDTDASWGEHVLARLSRFKLRTKAELRTVPWQCLWVFDGEPPPSHPHAWIATGWPGDQQFVLLGASVDPPQGAEMGAPATYERRRVGRGWPAMGTELDASTIPAESGIVDATVSFTKGCFTGQELVARIDSRGGHVPRHLRRLRARGGGVFAPGAEVVVDGKRAGTITSCVGDAALAYVARSVKVPAVGVAGGIDADILVD